MPPLRFERRQFLDRQKNPWFDHAEAELFLCERDGEVVGRITAHIDHRWDEFQGGNDGMFGFFDSVDDPEVAGSADRRGVRLAHASAGASGCSARWTSR